MRAALRVLVAAREQMSAERTAKVNALTALARTVSLGIDARRPLSGAQVAEISRWRERGEDIATATARAEAIRLAKRVTALETELPAVGLRVGAQDPGAGDAAVVRVPGVVPGSGW